MENKNENIKFSLPAKRVFNVCKEGKVELIIANKDFTKFRTLDQLIEMKGDITSEIVSIPMGEIVRKVKDVRDRYTSLFIEKKMCKKNGFVVEEKLKPQKLQEYHDLVQKRDAEINSIIAETNKFLGKKGKYNISLVGKVYRKDKLDDFVFSFEIGVSKEEKWYFLTSGEKFGVRGISEYYGNYWSSVSELREYQKELQEKYDGKKAERGEEKQIEENTEKYLEF